MNDLEELEKYLLQSVRERKRVPFSTKEVIQILKNYNPPEDLNELRDESIIQIMKEQFEKREH